MKRGFVGAILAGICVVLGVAVAYVSSKQDRTDPVITVSEGALTYTEGEGTEGLLTGVTASDKEDGDLTKNIFVEKVVPISENKAIVYYGVLDKSQNVGTATKEVEYFPAGQQPPQETAPAAEAAAQPLTVARGGNPAPQPLAPNGERPVIQLTTGTADIPAGGPFDPLSYVQGVVDDVDTADVLSASIAVEGAYDISKPGSYQLTYFVTDSAGNQSDPQVLNLTVH